MSFSFNNTVNGDGANIAQGQNVTQTNNQKFGGREIQRIIKCFETLATEATQVQPSFPAEQTELIQEFQTPSNLLTVAATQVEQELESEPLPPQEFEEKKTTWMNRFQAVAPSVLAVGLAGGEALLAASPASPIIAALLACASAAKVMLQGS